MKSDMVGSVALS